MASIAHSYRNLKLNMRRLDFQGQRHPEAFELMEDVMESAVLTSFCIRQVQLMEEELKVDHPHLSTFYRVLACVYFVYYVEGLNNIARAKGKYVPKTDMTAFIGDVVESGFRNPKGDPYNHLDELVREFCQTWSLPDDEVADLADAIVFMVQVEVRLDSLKVPQDLLDSLEVLTKTKTRVLMQGRPFIGGDRNISNTQRLLQFLSAFLVTKPPDAKWICMPDHIGIPWHEQHAPATKIQGDMDQLLMEDILPELLASCQLGRLSKKIPQMDFMFPLFKLIRHYLANPSKPVSLSLSFGLHAILTSIFELQGDNDVNFIAAAMKVCILSCSKLISYEASLFHNCCFLVLFQVFLQLLFYPNQRTI
jgi:hypothetical protein